MHTSHWLPSFFNATSLVCIDFFLLLICSSLDIIVLENIIKRFLAICLGSRGITSYFDSTLLVPTGLPGGEVQNALSSPTEWILLLTC